MLGTIIGDIIGSRFEFDNYLDKDFELFVPACTFTDDTAMTLAVAEAILDCQGDYGDLSAKAIWSMRRIGRQYPGCGYGEDFLKWLKSEVPKPYNSYGNGAAMRVSGCGFAASSLAEAKELSDKVTLITHNHPEGIKGARAISAIIFLARQKIEKRDLAKFIASEYYPLDFTLDEVRIKHVFDATCRVTVPQAIKVFLVSDGFEDTIRNAISIGGDSDTIAAIAGSIAEAYYGVPDKLKEAALPYLPRQLQKILLQFEAKFIENKNLMNDKK